MAIYNFIDCFAYRFLIAKYLQLAYIICYILTANKEKWSGCKGRENNERNIWKMQINYARHVFV